MNFRKRILFGAILLTSLIIAGTAGYWIMSGRFLDSLYMTVITVGTVGYGEIIDLSHSPAGRVFTIVFIIVSLLVIAIITSMLAASLVELELSGIWRKRRMNKEIAKLSNHYIVCGSGEIGLHVAQELRATNRPFVVIDLNKDALEKLAGTIPDLAYIVGDATDDIVLLSAGIDRAAGVVAALHSDKDNLYITVMAKELNSKARVVALGIEDKALDKLHRAGADAVVSAARIGGLRVASEMIRPSVVKFLDNMLRQTSHTVRFEEINVTAESPFLGKKLSEVPLKDKHGLLVVAIMRPGQRETSIMYSPPANTVLEKGDVIVVLGESHDFQQITK
ncbi:MAG: potassium channel protein [Planctomycetota bacterium]|nr:potassium channel protein [Planctomycetota bacterium]